MTNSFLILLMLSLFFKSMVAQSNGYLVCGYDGNDSTAINLTETIPHNHLKLIGRIFYPSNHCLLKGVTNNVFLLILSKQSEILL